MKNKLFGTLTILGLGIIALTASCNKDKKPAVTMTGEYRGSFEGTYLEHDTLTSSGYLVKVTSESDNKIKVEGNDFETFTVLVTADGVNIEEVTKSDESLVNFIYIGDEKKLKFTYNKDENEAEFIGIKQ